jgi:L-ascorbate 6-phosphate lactonase
MSNLARMIHETKVASGALAIFWISQAGFVYKTPSERVIYVDPYLTDYVHRLLPDQGYGFKRIMGTPIEPDEVEADFVVSTHSHPDHFDADAISILVGDPRVHFLGAPDCRAEYEKLGVPPNRYSIFEEEQTLDLGDFAVTGTYADHGDLAPDALGVVLTVGDINVWQVGDTAYRPDKWQAVFDMGLDIIVPPINGAYGNLNGVEAAKLARDARAKIAIPCHFWMFVEHNGDPAEFMEACREHAPEVQPLLMSQGELFMYEKAARTKNGGGLS